LNSTDSESGKVARPTTRKTRGDFFLLLHRPSPGRAQDTN
jgi:hypothetical protein